jgi:tetratricopeptide (TPR) repeat protein
MPSDLQAPPAPPQISPIEAEVIRIRRLTQASRFTEALQAAQALLRRVPENRDVLYLIAVNQRYAGQPHQALATLARLEELHPTYSRLYQERGHCHAALRDPAASLEAHLQAVSLNPALPAAWEALRILFHASGQTEDSKNAAAHVAKLKTLAPAVVNASSMFADGETFEAERIIRAHLKAHPQDVEGMRLLARIGIRLDVLDDAEFLLEHVLEFSPTYHAARADYVRVLLQRQRNVRAMAEARILMQADPENRDFRTVYATACVALSQYEEAIRIYRVLAEEMPGSGDLHLSIGHALKTQGDQKGAIAAYRQAYTVNPRFGDAYWSLANLKFYRFDDAELARMRDSEADRATSLIDRYHLCFALGKAFEDREDYAESFSFYARGNALKKAEVNYKPHIVELNNRLQAEVFTHAFLAARQGVGCPRPDPIFIVGLPRAGSTLIEQILASHSLVEGTFELADIGRMALQLQGPNHNVNAPRYPGILAECADDKFRNLGEKYLSDTAIYRTGKPYFIDKNPNNFRHIGLIHLILPNAKIIDARREKLACCFSNFKQLFAYGQDFTYGLEDIARYYRSYVALMAHWDQVLPGRILRVQHEDVVADLDASVRRILDFCGLEFQPQCLEFYKTARSVRTASSEQVRRPIFQEGLTQWKNYEPWLDELKKALS